MPRAETYRFAIEGASVGKDAAVDGLTEVLSHSVRHCEVHFDLYLLGAT